MIANLIFRSMLAAALAVPPTPAAAGKASPEAVDQGLGMAIMSAYVDVSGNLTGGSGAVGASKVANGQYFVAFSRSVEGCAYIAAISGPLSFAYSGIVTALGVSRDLGGATYYGVEVNTTDDDSIIMDRPFHLLVFCSQ